MKTYASSTYSFVILLLIALPLTGCVITREMSALEYRVASLERQSERMESQGQVLQEQMHTKQQGAEKDLRSQYAETSADLDALQEETRLLNGRIEELAHSLTRKEDEGEAIARRLDELSLTTAKLDQRFARIEQYLDLERTAKPGIAPSPAAAVTAPAATVPAATSASAPAVEDDQKIYDQAKQSFDNKEMAKAREQFAQLLKSYPKSKLANSAQYWIAESYYVDKWYEKAILEYQVVIEKYPNGNKVPAAMLKQAMAFVQLGDKANARVIFKELEKRYPQSNETKIAAQKLKEL